MVFMRLFVLIALASFLESHNINTHPSFYKRTHMMHMAAYEPLYVFNKLKANTAHKSLSKKC